MKQYGADLFDIHISKESSAHDEWLLDNEIGGMISRGVLSGITGMGADLMIIDDPIKNREEADSETHRGKYGMNGLILFHSFTPRCDCYFDSHKMA